MSVEHTLVREVQPPPTPDPTPVVEVQPVLLGLVQPKDQKRLSSFIDEKMRPYIAMLGSWLTIAVVGAGGEENQVGRWDRCDDAQPVGSTGFEGVERWIVDVLQRQAAAAAPSSAKVRLRVWTKGGKPRGGVTVVLLPASSSQVLDEPVITEAGATADDTENRGMVIAPVSPGIDSELDGNSKIPQQVRVLQGRLDASNASVLETELARQQERVDRRAAERELETARHEYGQLRSDHAALRGDHDRLREENRRLHDDVRHGRRGRDDLRAKLETARRKLERESEKAAKFRDRIGSLKVMLQEVKQERDSIAEERDENEAEIERIVEDLKEQFGYTDEDLEQ